MDKITVYEAEVSLHRIPFVVLDGEPYVANLVDLSGIPFAVGLAEGAIRYVGNENIGLCFVRASWLMGLFPEQEKLLTEMRRRLVMVRDAVDKSPDGDTLISFTG
jgi:hypothetical protein